jgi:hypothetical protein
MSQVINKFIAPGVDASKLADGSVSNTEFQYLNGVTAPIQTQLDDLALASGGINYITNYTADKDTVGWATYADAAQSRPVDGTGGTANITWTRSTSTPLRGVGKFVLTKDAVNRQGQGVSYDFTIDRADLAKPLQISFDYELISGTFNGSTDPATDSDIIVYIYDVTNNALIEPAGRLIEPIITGQTYRYRGTFQTSSNSTSYRLILHTATNSASAYTLGFDDFYVGPQVVSNGAVVTDWQSYTPTISGFGTPTNVSFFFRRVGDSIEIKGDFTSGTTTATAASITLPSGLTIDANKALTNFGGFYGYSLRSNSGATTRKRSSMQANSTTGNLVYFANDDNTASGSPGTALLGANYCVAGELISVFITNLPIQGWSSNVQVSSDTDTRVVSFVGRVGPQSLTGNTTNVSTSSVLKDSHGAWNGSVYTVPVSGDYEVSAFLYSVTASFSYAVWIDGSAYAWLSYSGIGNGGSNGRAILPNLKAGQQISIRSNVNTSLQNDTLQTINISRISGPSQIAASETVAGYANHSWAQNITNGLPYTTLTGWTTISDTHGIFNAANGVLTVNRSGFIDLSFTFSFAPNGTGSRALIIAVNDTVELGLVETQGFSGSAVGLKTGVSAYPVKAGDTIKFKVFQSSGGNLTPQAEDRRNTVSWRIY